MPRAHCPHCQLALSDAAVALPYPSQPMRCPHCQLIIGAGRAKDHGHVAGDSSRANGTAAGVLANAARREHAEEVDAGRVVIALREVASLRGCPLDRLRMLDYQEAALDDGTLPPLAGIITTFGTWKSARKAAVDTAHEQVAAA